MDWHAFRAPAGARDHDAVLHAELVGGQALQHPLPNLGVVDQELGDLCGAVGVLPVGVGC
jgi:hypothetical protein